MIITCPSCTRQLQVGDDLLGRKVKCPLCGTMFSTQAGSSPPATSTSADASEARRRPAEDFEERERRPAPPPRARRRSRERDDYDDDYDDYDDYDDRYDRRPGRRQSVEASVRAPAVALLVVGIIGVGLGPLSLLFFIFGGMGMFNDRGGRPDPSDVAVGTIGAVASSVQIVVSVLIVIGALKMQRFQSHGWGVTSSILAMIPAVSPCCLLGLPFGIWALAVLNQDDVKDAFGPYRG